MNSRGETEHYASEVFQSKLGVWFNQDVVSQARQMVASASEAQSNHDTGLSQIAEQDPEDDDNQIEADDEDGLDQDDTMSHSLITWDHTNDMPLKSDLHHQTLQSQQQQNNNVLHNQYIDYAATLKHRIHAPELRRTFSMPNPLQVHIPEAPKIKSYQSANRPQALDMKAINDENKFQMPQGPPSSSNPEYKALTIGNHAEVTAFLETRFRQLQQLVCKIVAKAWIKVIEPKKQTRYPYNKGEESKPLWWPDDVRHKEPDHLMKPERISLLMTMLRCAKVPTNRLELATAEVAAFIPPDKINLLREIYRVGREEERFKCREIPGETRIFVAATASVGPGSLEDFPSPSTAGLRPTDDITPRSASMSETHMALQRSTSHHATPQYDEADPFGETADIQQGYAMLPPQHFYYPNTDVNNYAPHPSAAVMNASSQSISSQQFQQAQQQQMYAAQHAHTRRQSAQPSIAIAPSQYVQQTWPHNLENSWPQSPPNSAVIHQPSMDQQMHQPQHTVGVPTQSTFYTEQHNLETPSKLNKNSQQDQSNRSSPYLPTPLRPDPNFSAQRNGQGVSFSDYLQSPRTGGPGPLHGDDPVDVMHEEYH